MRLMMAGSRSDLTASSETLQALTGEVVWLRRQTRSGRGRGTVVLLKGEINGQKVARVVGSPEDLPGCLKTAADLIRQLQTAQPSSPFVGAARSIRRLAMDRIASLEQNQLLRPDRAQYRLREIDAALDWLSDHRLTVTNDSLLRYIATFPPEARRRREATTASRLLAEVSGFQLVVPREYRCREPIKRPTTGVALGTDEMVQSLLMRLDQEAPALAWFLGWCYATGIRFRHVYGLRDAIQAVQIAGLQIEVGDTFNYWDAKRNRPSQAVVSALPPIALEQLPVFEIPWVESNRAPTDEQHLAVKRHSNRLLSQLHDRLGVDARWVTAHHLRHLATCRLLSSGMAPLEVCELLSTSMAQLEARYSSIYRQTAASRVKQLLG